MSHTHTTACTRGMSVEDRLIHYVPERGDGCWLWTGAVQSSGYGTIWVDGKQMLAHRHAYEQWVGPIPDGLTLDHLADICTSPLCVRPGHLEPVTGGENAARPRRARTHCPKNHPLDGVKRKTDGTTRRYCLTCHRDQERARYRARV